MKSKTKFNIKSEEYVLRNIRFPVKLVERIKKS